jgi:hypothetical protein
VAYDFPEWWQAVPYASSSSVTLVMVFKLDELLRAQPAADGSLIAVEEATDQELDA